MFVAEPRGEVVETHHSFIIYHFDRPNALILDDFYKRFREAYCKYRISKIIFKLSLGQEPDERMVPRH